MYPWYLLYSLGIRRNDPLYRAYIGIAHRGPTLGSGNILPIPWIEGMNQRGMAPRWGFIRVRKVGIVRFDRKSNRLSVGNRRSLLWRAGIWRHIHGKKGVAAAPSWQKKPWKKCIPKKICRVKFWKVEQKCVRFGFLFWKFAPPKRKISLRTAWSQANRGDTGFRKKSYHHSKRKGLFCNQQFVVW